MKNNIVLITENERLAKKIKSKIVLLRNSDEFFVTEPKDCFDSIKKNNASVIFFHLTKFNEDDFWGFLQKTKQTPEIKTSSIILLYDSLDEEILCAAFELGISDFIHTKATETEFTVRTIWCLQKQEKNLEIYKKTELLKELKIIDDKADVYTENYTTSIIKQECKTNHGSLVILAPDVNVRNKISPKTIITIAKKSIRSQDIIGFSSDFKILIWLKKANKKNALDIINKIQKNLTKDYTISAGYTEINDSAFEKAFESTNKALSKALLKGNGFVYTEDKTRKENNKKLINQNEFEKIISPLFFQYQKLYEEKLFETKITQSSNKNNSYFKLICEKGQSTFVVKNKNNQNIEIEILHNIQDCDIQADKIYIDYKQFNQEQIENLINSFIKEFQSLTKN